jgi:hypothetical protein
MIFGLAVLIQKMYAGLSQNVSVSIIPYHAVKKVGVSLLLIL